MSNTVYSMLNLNIKELQNNHLLQNPTYRRLYNVIREDFVDKQENFRKHLIKELYFLLRITPTIEKGLQDNYLQQVQEIYDSNDRKKIHLSSNKLFSLVKKFAKPHQSLTKQQRPLTGSPVNRGGSQFLRPFTAFSKKINEGALVSEISSPNKQLQHRDLISTQVDSNEQISLHQHALTIEEEKEMSLDFKKNHRTIHPDEETPYEQLLKLMHQADNISKRPHTAKVSSGQFMAKQQGIDTKYSSRTKEPMIGQLSSIITSDPKARQSSVQSATIIPVPVPQQPANQQELEPFLPAEEQQQQQDSSPQIAQPTKSTRQLYSKAYTKDRHSNVRCQSANILHRPKKELLPRHTEKFEQKISRQVHEDHEIAKQFVDFTKKKSIQRSQQIRKIEAKRMLKSAGIVRTPIVQKESKGSTTNIAPPTSHSTNPLIVDMSTDIPKPIQSNMRPKTANNFMSHRQLPTYDKRDMLRPLYSQEMELYKKIVSRKRNENRSSGEKGNTGFSQSEQSAVSTGFGQGATPAENNFNGTNTNQIMMAYTSSSMNNTQTLSETAFNQTAMLNKGSKDAVSPNTNNLQLAADKPNLNQSASAKYLSKPSPAYPFTRFNQGSLLNYQIHNQEAIEEIEKIRMKVHGKGSVSMEALTKALMFAVQPPKAYNPIKQQQGTSLTSSKSTSALAVGAEYPIWHDRDLYYNMLEGNTKKKTKKGGKKIMKKSRK